MEFRGKVWDKANSEQKKIRKAKGTWGALQRVGAHYRTDHGGHIQVGDFKVQNKKNPSQEELGVI